MRDTFKTYGNRSRNHRSEKPAGNRLPQEKSKKIFYYILFGFLLLTIIFLSAFGVYSVVIIRKFEAAIHRQNENTVMYDINGIPFYTVQGKEDRKYVTLDQISENVPKMTLAIEDSRFFKHFGFDPIRLTRAVIGLFVPGSYLQGASTVTQQLAKLTLFSSEISFSRKLREFFAAIALEMRYSKEQILEFYLNRIYLGGGNYGIYNASLNYFGKLPSELNLAESAVLAGMIKKPEGYSPLNDAKKTRLRQTIALRRALELGWVRKKEYLLAKNTKVKIERKRASNLNLGPYFANQVLIDLLRKFSPEKIYGSGMKIYTTLNSENQRALEKTIRKRLKKPRSFQQVASVSINPKNGYITALVGGSNFAESEFNRATQAKRQPGSSFKPIVYTAALLEGYQPDDIFIDEPTYYPNDFFVEGEPEFYEPQNFNQDHLGEITLAYALQESNNVVSVKIANQVGLKEIYRLSRRFGINLPQKRGLCVALGCGETTLLNLVNAYTVFDNKGKILLPVMILKVVDAQGKVLFRHTPEFPKTVIPEETAQTMTSLLNNVVTYGTGRNAYIPEILGGKTGTNDDFRDAWFVGYTADLVTGFWIGNDDNEPMDHEVGGGTPAGLWKDYMKQLR